MLKTGFNTSTGMMQASDKRVAWGLISLFGMIGYFVESVLEKINASNKKMNSEE